MPRHNDGFDALLKTKFRMSHIQMMKQNKFIVYLYQQIYK